MHAKSLVCKMLGDVSKPRWKGCVFVDACLFLPVFQTQWQGCAGRIWKVCLVFARRAIHLCCRAWWGWNAQIWWYRYLPFSETILSILYLIKIDIFPIHKKEKHTQHFGTPFAAEKDCSICQGCWDAAEWLAGLPSISRWIHSFEGGGPFGTRWMSWWYLMVVIWMMELMISVLVRLHLFSSTIHRVGHHQFLVWLVSPIQCACGGFEHLLRIAEMWTATRQMFGAQAQQTQLGRKFRPHFGSTGSCRPFSSIFRKEKKTQPATRRSGFGFFSTKQISSLNNPRVVFFFW